MFTGIITDIGRVRSIERSGDTRMLIETAYDSSELDMGASIAHSGVCLTVVDKGCDANQHWYAVDISDETLSCTTLGSWSVGTRMNLERPMRADGEFGGHIVSGHVDGVAEIIGIDDIAESKTYTFKAPENLKRYIAPKGSITVDGVSLTVNKVGDRDFTVNVIPHTQQVTTLGRRQIGGQVNIEIDMLARYVARLQEVG